MKGSAESIGTIRSTKISSSQTRIGLVVGDREVSWLIAFMARIRIGREVVKAGIVGHVETLQDCRHRGYGSRVMAATLDRFAARKCDIGFLFGIPVYYQGFHYDTVVPYHAVALDLWRAKLQGDGGMPCRPFEAGDEAAVARLYAQAFAAQTGAFVRDAASWREGAGSRLLSDTLCCTDARGRCVGYAKCGGGDLFHARWTSEELLPSALIVPEAAAAGEAEATALMHALAARAAADGKRYLLYLGPAVGPFGQALYRCGGQRRQCLTPNGGLQARIVNLPALMEKLAPDLALHLENSRFAAARFALTLRTEAGSVELRMGGGQVAVRPGGAGGVEIGMRKLVQLIFGFLPTAGIAGEEGQILDVLFPPQLAYSCPLDEIL
jgi:hypothetical protein